MGEVFLWRGTVEQRATRSLSGKWERFTYFDHQLDYPDWRDKLVLDFGGNEGNLLLDHYCSIRHENYYCLDVIKEALEVGRMRHPQAHWIHYNRYNCSFNPEGIKALPIPKMDVQFDVVLAYSVFTHTSREEMHDLVGQLTELLAPGGTLAFTFIDPHWGNNLQRRMQQTLEPDRILNLPGLMEQSRGTDWCAVVNGSELHLNNNGTWSNEIETCVTYDVYHSVTFMRREFPGALIRPPVEGHMQHCCIIRR
jgi:SAM-dependent methyltransferase